MNRRAFVLALLLCVPLAASSSDAARLVDQAPSKQDHIAWVDAAMRRMETVKSGMTRAALLQVFETEGGLSTPLHRTYVSKDCPYFKVDVDFEAVARPSRDSSGRVSMVEGSRDVIVKISRPYLQFTTLD